MPLNEKHRGWRTAHCNSLRVTAKNLKMESEDKKRRCEREPRGIKKKNKKNSAVITGKEEKGKERGVREGCGGAGGDCSIWTARRDFGRWMHLSCRTGSSATYFKVPMLHQKASLL